MSLNGLSLFAGIESTSAVVQANVYTVYAAHYASLRTNNARNASRRCTYTRQEGSADFGAVE